ncbi:MAG: hypothetical protein KF823_05785 [Xanthomonadales bacterium]|nr:hypothetical protein [Xanthomonadales bacterium]
MAPMQEHQQTSQRPAFTVIALWAETARMLQRHAGDLLRVLVLPALLQLGLAWQVMRATGEGRQGLAWLLVAAAGLGIALFATNCHRVVLGDGGPVRSLWGLRLDGRVLWYLAWSVFLVLAGTLAFVPVLVLGILVVPALFPGMDPEELARLFEWLAWLPLILIIHLLIRLSLVLPATALGRDTHPGESWHLTHGHGWRLTLGLCLPAVAVRLFEDVLGRLTEAVGSAPLTLVVALLATLAGAVTVVALSCAWRLLGPDDDPTPEAPLR